MSGDFPAGVRAALDRFQAAGRIARFWLRDDDAVAPSAALDRLLALAAAHGVPLALAVIPEPSGEALAARLAGAPEVGVLVHGWRHSNHAGDAAKKRELGPDRPAETVLDELARGFAKLASLHGGRFRPVLVPPWNRIDPALLPHLPALGFEALSVYGPEKAGAIRMINTHVDVIDWHGSRGCRDWAGLENDLVARLDSCLEAGDGSVGLLTHHLVHDARVHAFLERLFAATVAHPAARWVDVSTFLGE